MLRRKNTAQRAVKSRIWIRIGVVLLALMILVTTIWYFTIHRVQYQPEWYESVQSKPLTAFSGHNTNVIPTSAGFISTTDSVFWAADTEPVTLSPAQETSSATDQSRGQSQSTNGAKAAHSANKTKNSTSIWARVQRDLEQNGRATVIGYELVPLFIEMLKAQGKPEWAALIKAGKTTIHKNHIVTETMLDLRQVPTQQLRAKAAQAWDMVREMIPNDRLAQVYLKADTWPAVNRGYLRLGDNASLSVGKIALPLAELEKRFNMPVQIEMDRFMFRKIEFGEGQLVLIK
jgi:hypothetical protein